MRPRLIASIVLCALCLQSSGVLAQAEGTPGQSAEASPTPMAASPEPMAGSPTPTGEARDLYLDMPYYLGGYEPDVVMTRGVEHFANLGADDERRVDLEAFLDRVGAHIEDLVSGYALVSQDDLFSFVVAIRVAGAEPGTLLPAYLPILYGDLVDPSVADGNAGGKEVTIISSSGDDDETVELYVYDQGDTLWMLHGPIDVVESTLEKLPVPR